MAKEEEEDIAKRALQEGNAQMEGVLVAHGDQES